MVLTLEGKKKKKSYKWILKGDITLMEHWSILYKFLVEKTSLYDWYLKQCSQGPGGLVLTFWSTRTGRSAGVTVLITQNQKERLTKVLSTSTFYIYYPSSLFVLHFLLLMKVLVLYGLWSPCVHSGLQDWCLFLCLLPLTAADAQDAESKNDRKSNKTSLHQISKLFPSS